MTERVLGIFMFMLLLSLPVQPAFGELKASFRYPLSNFSGPVRSQWAQLAVDQERNEIYALNRRENDIRIFDAHGMEIHAFGEGLGSAADIAIGDDGDIFILTRGPEPRRFSSSITGESRFRKSRPRMFLMSSRSIGRIACCTRRAPCISSIRTP